MRSHWALALLGLGSVAAQGLSPEVPVIYPIGLSLH